MIQATDLRLGNLVMHEDTIFKIRAIGVNTITIQSPIKVVEIDPDGDDVNPIPITAKFFKERGYKHDYHHNDITISSDYRVEFSLSKGYLIDSYGLMVEINYIHELQNLYYALNKTELKLTP